MRNDGYRADPRAVQVARAVLLAQQPDLAILFGSRARGDYRESNSDIDVMLVQDEKKGDDDKRLAAHNAEQAAREIYGREVDTQLVWRTREEFRLGRRYVNSLETRAAREGTIIPRNPEDYSAEDYQDEKVESQVDWSSYEQRLSHAEIHLDDFVEGCEQNKNDLLIGQRAQRAMEHAMKALLEASRADYRKTHDIGELLGNIRHYDREEMGNFSLAMNPDVYTEYEGDREYGERIQPLITEFPGYQESTAQAVETILERAKEIRALGESAEDTGETGTGATGPGAK